MRQWFWRSSFAERYRGAPDSFITKDLEVVLNFVSSGNGAQVSDFGEIPRDAELKASVFRKNNSRSRAFTLALAKSSPLNLTNASPVDTADALSVYNKKQFHHIFPEAFLRRTNPKVERSYVLNFCMLAASENNLISDDDPKDYLPRLIRDLGSHADEVLRSNLMPDTSAYNYESADLATFIDARLVVVRAKVLELCQGSV